MNDSYIVDLLSTLDQKRSQKQLNDDIKQIEKTLNMLRLTGTFARGETKKNLNAYIQQLSNQLSTIKLKAKIDSKSIKSDVNNVLNKVSFKDIDALNIGGNKTKLKVQKVIADTKAYVEKNPISIGIDIDSKRSKLDNDLTTYLNRNSKINESSVLLKEADKVRDLIGAINDKKSLREATDAFQLYKSEVSATGFATKSTTDRIKDMLSHVTKLGSIFSISTLAVNNFTKSLGTLKDIDDILTEISKTSNMTTQELEKLGDTSFKAASKYGKTASDYLTGIQEMSRSGFYGEKGAAMAEQSLLAQAAGDMTADVANNYILATNAAYKYNGEATKLNAVLDGQNSITNRNSVSLEDMASAMSKAGTVASSYRVSVEDLSAMIGTIESVTKAEGDEVGNAIKAILINLQNVTSSKITDTLDAASASMTEFVNGTEKLRDPISILRDLATTFNQLDEDDALRAEILTNIGGKHQSAKLAALLQNMEMFDKMLVDYSEGAGSAMEEAMKSANNWSGKINQLQNSWDSLVNSITNKNAVLSGLTFGDKLIQGAESFINTFGTIPTILTAVNSSIVAMRKDYGLTKIWDKENKKIDLEGNIFGIDFSAIKNQKKHFEEAKEAIAIWNSKLRNGKSDLETFNYTVVQNNAQLKEYLSTTSKDAPASLNGYRKHLESTGQATEDLRLKTLLLNTAFTFLGGIAVQAVITGITNAFDKFNETVEESQGKVNDINSKISDLQSQLKELNNLEYKSEFDNQKIAQLEKELGLQEKILEIEQKRLYQNQIGTRFSDYFDADSLVSKQQAENDRNNQDRYSNLSRRYRTNESLINDIDTKLDSLQEKLNSEDLIGHDRFMIEGEIAKLTEKRTDLLEKQQTIEDQLIVNMGEYLKNQQTAQEAIDSGLLTGSDLEKAESMVEYWNQMYQDSSEIMTNIQKMNGTYNNTNDLLEEKFSGISRDDLVSLSDDDKRIALSFDPDNIIGFEELKQKIAETKGDIDGLNETDISVDTTGLSGQLTSSEESLDKFQESIASATEAYSKLISGDYSSSELLDCLQAINKAMSDMGGSVTWESLKDQADSLDMLGDEIRNISQAYAESILSGAGIGIDSGFGQMLTDIIQQIYDTEAAFDGMNARLDSLQSSYQTLTGILQSYNETGYISLDNLQSLLTADSNLIAMLEVENGQLVLNQSAYENLVAVQLLEFKAKLDDAAAAEIEALAKQKAEEATNRNADASNSAVAKLDAETAAFNRNTSAAISNAVAKAEESGVSTDDIQGVFDKYNKVWEAAQKNYKSDFSGFMGNTAKAAKSAAKETQKEVDVMAELNSEMDKLQSAYKSLCDIKDTYNQYGKITVDQYQELTDMGFNFLAQLVDENGQLGLNANAFEKLAQAKLEEMQIQMARNATDTITGLKTEAEAVEYLTFANENLRDAALSAAEAQLQSAVAMAKLRGEQQGLAAEQIYQGYEASKQLAGKVDFFFDPSAKENTEKATKEDKTDELLEAYNKEKALLDHMLSMDQISKKEYYDKLLALAKQYFEGDEEHQDQLWDAEEAYHEYMESIKKTYNWIEIFLDNLAKKTNALIDKAGKFISWAKKNAMINRAVKATDKQITGQTNAYAYYAEKARKVGLNNAYIDKIQNGTLTMEDMQNEALSGKIEKYQEWYDKMVACEDAINDLYDQERDLIKQKLDNVLDYYNDLDSYMSSIVSKMDSFISLMDDMGKRSSLSDLLEQFAAANDQITHFQSQTTTEKVSSDKNYFDSSKRVEAAKKEDAEELISSLTEDKNQIATGIQNTGTYKKLLQDIAKAQLAYDKHYDKLWAIDPDKDKNGKKAETAQKKLDKLEDKLNALTSKRDDLEANATANNVASYSKVYDQYMKLYNKRDALEEKGKELSAKDTAKMESLFDQMIDMGKQRDDAIKELENQIGIADGSKKDSTEAEKLQKQIKDIDDGVKNSATYQNLEKDIDTVQAKIDKFWDTHDSATKAQQKQLDKWESQLEAYYEKQKQLEENATADTVGEYAKVYDAWRKLQDKLDAGKVLSVNEYKNYN